ncbi:MAG TPA: hypothetical protein VLV16_08520 [Gemmatimonadales bacterium]|nr:hypothetical protein [Gemmatimonadales bacterium]
MPDRFGAPPVWKQVVSRVRKATLAGEASPLAAALDRPVQIDPAVPSLSLTPSADPPAQPRLIFPDELLDSAYAAQHSGSAGLGRALRTIAYVALGALAGVGAWTFFMMPRAPAASATTAQTPSTVEAVGETSAGALAGAVTQAVSSFDLRARMFEGRQMQCADLARGLVLVEESWTAYSTRPQAGVAMDSAGQAGDRSLYASVDQIERRFERSGCPRP